MSTLFDIVAVDDLSWEALRPLPSNAHEARFLSILKRHGFVAQSPVPLLGRYTRGRRWTAKEFELCYRAWRDGISLTLVAATLNRNPQDMIYKLLNRCRQEGFAFSERGRSEGSKNWTPEVATCAKELFAAGLPAWKIAVLFRVDFEFTEKALFLGRADYGHQKRNPFSICTDHKQVVNAKILSQYGMGIVSALELFAGEGRLTRLVEKYCPSAAILAVESDRVIFEHATSAVWKPSTRWINKDNLAVLAELNGEPFDLVDLDPFVSCCDQLRRIWPILSPQALVFVTFGGEYRRSFINSNRKAIFRRYGFNGFDLDNRTYLQKVPSFFLGWIAGDAAKSGFKLELLRAVRYPNNCRFWMRATNTVGSDMWLEETTAYTEEGRCWLNLDIPRFREVRAELDGKNAAQLHL